VKVQGKFGYIGRDGAFVIPPQFDDAFEFREGMARVVQDGLVGFVDKQGVLVVPPKYFKAGDFQEGMALACLRNKCGYLLKTGAVAVGFAFDDAKSFSSGLAPVREGESWGYINPRGEWAAQPRYFEAHEFTEGTALVGLRKDFSYDRQFGGYSGTKTFYGFIDPSGREVIEPKILAATPFSHGLSRVQLPAGGLCSDCYVYRFLKRDGGMLPGTFDTATPFQRGQAVVTAYGLRGKTRTLLIDGSGQALFEFEGRDYGDFAYRARTGSRLGYGYVDRAGRAVIAHAFSSAQAFRNGLAFVTSGAAQQYIDTSGQAVLALPKRATQAFPFSDGLALVADGSTKFGYLDRSGQARIEPRFYAALPFSEGLAAVKMSKDLGQNNWGYIDTQGKMAIPPSFHRAGPFSGGLALVEILTPERYLVTALINPSGNTVVHDPHLPRLLRRTGHRPSYPDWEELRRLSLKQGLVPKLRRPEGGMGFVDREDRFVIGSADFIDAAPFSEGLAPVLVQTKGWSGGRWGYVNTRGETVIEPRFTEAGAFSDGLALVKDVAGRLGYLDRTGHWSVPPSFLEEAWPFSDGLALVKLNGRYGFIDKAGEFAIPARYFRAESFSEGLAVTAVEIVDARKAARRRK
jgi:hypothetical protein